MHGRRDWKKEIYPDFCPDVWPVKLVFPVVLKIFNDSICCLSSQFGLSEDLTCHCHKSQLFISALVYTKASWYIVHCCSHTSHICLQIHTGLKQQTNPQDVIVCLIWLHLACKVILLYDLCSRLPAKYCTCQYTAQRQQSGRKAL